jgi:Mg2+ and Co2+ transporter CorA
MTNTNTPQDQVRKMIEQSEFLQAIYNRALEEIAAIIAEREAGNHE